MKSFPPLILASTSPQRKLLVEQMGLDFAVHALDCPEDHDQSLDAEELVRLICMDKLAAARTQIPEAKRQDRGILCSDTMVALDHHRLGKPVDRAEAGRFLDLLSGRTHQVITGMVWLPPGAPQDQPGIYRASVSDVSFRTLSPADREWYLESGEWREAAGAYRIQGKGACLISQIRGSWTGIMGLAVEVLYELLGS